MRRLLYIATLSLVASLLFAPAALGQAGSGIGGDIPPDPTGNCLIVQEYIPEVNGCVAAEGNPDPREAIVFDADTGEPLGTLAEVTGGSNGDDDNADDQYTPAADQYAAPADDTAPLPATGGPALLLSASVLLLGAGLLGLGLVRRS